MKSRRYRMDPMECIRQLWPDASTDHIAYDPRVRHQYRVIRGCASDGTHLFEVMEVSKALGVLVNSQTYYTPMGHPPAGTRPFYTIGHVRVAAVYGLVDLPCGKVPGERMSVTIPVRVEYRSAG